MIMVKKKSTLKQIENLRLQLERTVNDKGYTNIETIKVSQKLDSLLNKYIKYDKDR